MKKKSVSVDGSMNVTIALFVLAALMIGTSIYLTQHYMNTKFPTGLSSGSLCNLNSFFNCDKTTTSPLSNIAGVPISLFGVLIGALTMLGLFVKNEGYEKTLHFILLLNFLGCVLLFAYSLAVLGGLCPFCTLYYIFSGLTLWIFYKNSELGFIPQPLPLAIFAIAFLAVGLVMKKNIDSKLAQINDVTSDLIKQYYSLPNLGAPATPSGFKIATAANAPIKMVIFSDFECPACKILSESMPQIILRYGGKIDIEYYFYPLDNNCNPSMTNPLHQYACRAAYFATCMPAQNFGTLHDEIFHNQERLSDYLTEAIAKNNVKACVDDPKTKEKVAEIIRASNPFNIRSTPSFLLNGVKIEGVLPNEQLFAIMDEILKRHQNP